MDPREELLENLVAGTVKVADVDPSLQWGMVGAGVGAGGSMLRSIASGESLRETLRRAAVTGALGAAAGTGISAGTRLLGYKSVTPKETLHPAKRYEPTAAGAIGLGAAGAGGLGALSEIRQEHLRNRSVGDFFFGGDSAHVGKKPPAKAKGSPGFDDIDVAPAPQGEADTVDNFLSQFRGGSKAVAGKAHEPLPGAMNKLLGRTNYGTSGMSALRSNISRLEKAGDPEGAAKAIHLKALLERLRRGPEVLEAFPQAERYAVDPLLKATNFKNPKGLLAAAAALGLGHLAAGTVAANMGAKQ